MIWLLDLANLGSTSVTDDVKREWDEPQHLMSKINTSIATFLHRQCISEVYCR